MFVVFTPAFYLGEKLLDLVWVTQRSQWPKDFYEALVIGVIVSFFLVFFNIWKRKKK